MIDQFYLLTAPDADPAQQQNEKAFLDLSGFKPLAGIDELADGAAAFYFQHNKLHLKIPLEQQLTDLSFDFADGEVGFRAARVSKSNELVARAIGCKSHYRPTVLDATAGMGRDALIMAMLGCRVYMQERNNAIFYLLQNALERFRAQEEFADVSSRLSIDRTDSLNALSNPTDLNEKSIEVIYLDPMFPERKKSALVKKEMRLFKLLAGEDPDADALLENALTMPVKRVVVKRPKGAPELANKKPSHVIAAKKFRYDIYLLSTTP